MRFYGYNNAKIFVKWDSNIGIINLNLSYDFDKDELDYLHIEYSDDEIKSFVDKNPSLLIK